MTSAQRILCFLSLILGIICVSAADDGCPFSIDKNGVLKIGNGSSLSFQVNYRKGDNKNALFTPDPYFHYAPKREEKGNQVIIRSQPGKEYGPESILTYTKESATRWTVNLKLIYPEDFTVNFAAFELAMPIAEMAGKDFVYRGKAYPFPAECIREKGFAFFHSSNVSEFEIPYSNGTLKVKTAKPMPLLQMNDSRFFSAKAVTYSARMRIPTEGGVSEMAATLEWIPAVEAAPAPAVQQADKTPFDIDKNGVLKIGNGSSLGFQVNYRKGDNKNALFTPDPYFHYAPKREEKGNQVIIRSQPGKEYGPESILTYTKESATRWTVNLKLIYPEDFTVNFAAFELAMPIAEMAGKDFVYRGKAYPFPAECIREKGFAFFHSSNVSEFEIPYSDGTLKVKTSKPMPLLQMNDSRFFSAKAVTYSARMRIPTEGGVSEMAATLEWLPAVKNDYATDAAVSAAAEAQCPFEVDKNGILTVEGEHKLGFQVNYTKADNKAALFTQNPYFLYAPVQEAKGNQVIVTSRPGKENGPDSILTITKDSPLRWRVACKLIYPDGFKLNFAAMEFTMPLNKMQGKSFSYGGKDYPYPKECVKEKGFAFFHTNNAQRMEFELSNGLLVIEAAPKIPLLQLNDGRWFSASSQHYSARMRMPYAGNVSEMELTLTYHPYTNVMVSLADVANRPFAVSSEGAEQDRAPLKPGILEVSPARFQIAAGPDKLNRVLTLAKGDGDELFPRSATVAVKPQNAGTIYLLHAISWPPAGNTEIGSLKVHYTTGEAQIFPVVYEVDVTNWWWGDAIRKNAVLGWKDKIMIRGEWRDVGLVVSRFLPDRNRAIKAIEFNANASSGWMIAGVTLSPQVMALPKSTSTSFTMERNNTWKLYTPALRVEPGSALDFSFQQDAPAGKYGNVIVREDATFALEKTPEKEFRIWGTNVAFDTTIGKKEQADYLVENLKAFGYNAVRMHHFDRMLVHVKKDTPVDMELLNNFYYTLSAMRKAGIYYSIDLFTARPFDLKSVPGVKFDPKKNYYQPWLKDEYALAAMLIPAVRKDLKDFTRVLLASPNPYQAEALKDDPALISISLINENSILACINHPLSIVKEQYLRAFDEYIAKNGIAVNDANRETEFKRFVLKVYDEYYEDMVRFLREELGTKALITDQNFIGYPNLAFQRIKYDLVDEHLYCGRDTSISRMFNNFDKIPRRSFGKPFQISEFSYTYPNSCRPEGGLLYPAMAAMQGWNGLYRFCHSNRWDLVMSPTTGLEMFDMVNDPARNIPERIAGMIFLRGDVQPLPVKIPTAVGFESSLKYGVKDFPLSASALLFSAQVGALPVAPDGKSFMPWLPEDTAAIISMAPEYKGKPGIPVIDAYDDAALSKFAEEAGMVEHRKAKIFSSATGEVHADYNKKLISVVTPKTEGYYFDTIGGDVNGTALKASCKGQALIAATSLDNKPLRTSKRVLLVHVTDMQNEGTVFSDETMQTVLKSVHKQRPVRILFRNATAKISFRTAIPNVEIYALDCSGKRLQTVPFTRKNGWLSFNATTDMNGTACFAYEVVQK